MQGKMIRVDDVFRNLNERTSQPAQLALELLLTDSESSTDNCDGRLSHGNNQGEYIPQQFDVWLLREDLDIKLVQLGKWRGKIGWTDFQYDVQLCSWITVYVIDELDYCSSIYEVLG